MKTLFLHNLVPVHLVLFQFPVPNQKIHVSQLNQHLKFIDFLFYLLINFIGSEEEDWKPHCFVKTNKSKEFIGCTSMSEAFHRLDLARAVVDVRRFNYVCKVFPFCLLMIIVERFPLF